VKNCGNEEIDEGKVIQIDLIELWDGEKEMIWFIKSRNIILDRRLYQNEF
jgi:hypothetical protein